MFPLRAKEKTARRVPGGERQMINRADADILALSGGEDLGEGADVLSKLTIFLRPFTSHPGPRPSEGRGRKSGGYFLSVLSAFLAALAGLASISVAIIV